jgi:hypothetical protein
MAVGPSLVDGGCTSPVDKHRVLVPVIHKKARTTLDHFGVDRAGPGPNIGCRCSYSVRAADRITLTRRPLRSVHRDPLDPRTQPRDAADRAEGPVGVDLELVERAGGAGFVVKVLPVS